MSALVGSTTVDCPACREPLDVPLVGRADEQDKALVWVQVDLTVVREHGRTHGGQAGGRGDGTPGQDMGSTAPE